MYKVDDGEWFEYPDDQTKIDVPNGSKIYLKGDNNTFKETDFYTLKLEKKSSYSSLIRFNIGGYLTSLIQSTKFDEVDTVPDYAFNNLIYNHELISAQNLITDNIKNVGLKSFYRFFYGCFSLQTLPEGMFGNITSVGQSSFFDCFYNCTSLTTLPEGMFGNITSVGQQTFQSCFSGCTSLTTLPSNMFANITSVSIYSFQNCFTNCTSLTTLPEGMFSSIPNAHLGSFNYCFYNCTSLTTLPEGMFSSITSTNGGYSFQGCFSGCTSLTTLPSNMFANITSVNGGETFKSCFQNCTSLLVGPNFKNITGSTSHDAFDNCFDGCSNLQLIYAPSMSAWNESYFQDWVKGVFPTGKMYVKSGVVPPTGTSGLPEGWQLLNY